MVNRFKSKLSIEWAKYNINFIDENIKYHEFNIRILKEIKKEWKKLIL